MYIYMYNIVRYSHNCLIKLSYKLITQCNNKCTSPPITFGISKNIFPIYSYLSPSLSLIYFLPSLSILCIALHA